MVYPEILILTGQPLCHNPRVVKEADTLSTAGYAVGVLGGWTDDALAIRDRDLMGGRPWTYTPVIDLRDRRSLRGRLIRTRTRLGRELGARLGLENRWQLGYAAPGLWRHLVRVRPALAIAHSEAALWAVHRWQGAGQRIGVDMEDWFSEDLPPTQRHGRPLRLLRKLERETLRGAAHATCPSQQMSSALAGEFGCHAPAVVYNAFPPAGSGATDGSQKDRPDRHRPSLHWFSQTLGPGRGLEQLIAALGHLRGECELHLRGRPAAGFDEWLRAHAPRSWLPRLHFHPLVNNTELPWRIAEHDIGFAGELPDCRSRDLTITNKLFQYLAGGLAVVASDTAGQREFATLAPGAVFLYPAYDPRALAGAIDRLLQSPETLQRARAATALSHGRWDDSADRLVASVKVALSAPSVLHR